MPSAGIELLRAERVTVWYTAPTAIRMLMKAGAELSRAIRSVRAAVPGQRRRAAESRSGVWGQEAFGLPFHDNWWQTETGGIMIANFAAWTSGPARWAGRCRASKRRSSAQRGWRRSRRSPSRTCRANWPCGRAGRRCSAATGTSRSATQKCFAGGFYLTGDLARRDRGRILLVRRPQGRRDQEHRAT